MRILFSDDSSPSSDEGYSERRSSIGTSNFTVSSRSAFQPSIPRPSPPQNQTTSPESRNTEPTEANNSEQPENTTSEPNVNGDRNQRTLRMITHELRMALDSFQRSLNSDRTNQTDNLSNQADDENASEQSENGYWLLEENSNSDSNQEDQNLNSSSNFPRWTSRWIQLDPMNRDSDYELFPSDQLGRRHSSDRAEPLPSESRTQGSSTDRNQLSPISINSTRYEQPPLFPFRSLRENQARRMESNQEASAGSSTQTDGRSDNLKDQDSRPTTSQNNEDGLRDGEDTRNSRRQQASMKRASNNAEAKKLKEERNRRARAGPLPQGQGLSDNVGVRQGIQLLSRYIDNMQRLCR